MVDNYASRTSILGCLNLLCKVEKKFLSVRMQLGISILKQFGVILA